MQTSEFKSSNNKHILIVIGAALFAALLVIFCRIYQKSVAEQAAIAEEIAKLSLMPFGAKIISK